MAQLAPWAWTVLAGGAGGLSLAGLSALQGPSQQMFTYWSDMLYQINDQLKGLQDRSQQYKVYELYKSIDNGTTVTFDDYLDNPELYTSKIRDKFSNDMNTSTDAQTEKTSNGKSWLSVTISSFSVKLLKLIKELVNEKAFEFNIGSGDTTTKTANFADFVNGIGSKDSVCNTQAKKATSNYYQPYRRLGGISSFPNFTSGYYVQCVIVMWNYKHNVDKNQAIQYALTWFTSTNPITRIETEFTTVTDTFGRKALRIIYHLYDENGKEVTHDNDTNAKYYINNVSSGLTVDPFQYNTETSTVATRFNTNYNAFYTTTPYDSIDSTEYSEDDYRAFWYINNMTYDGSLYHYSEGGLDMMTTSATSYKLRSYDKTRSKIKETTSEESSKEAVDNADLTITVPSADYAQIGKNLADAIASNDPDAIAKAIADLGVVAADATEDVPLDKTKPSVKEAVDDNEVIKDSSVYVPIPSIPDITTNGFVSIYKLDQSNLNSLGGYLWSANFFDSITKIFSNPIEALINAYSMPVSFGGTTTNVKIGNVTMDTVQGSKLSSAIQELDLGSIIIPSLYNNFLDYEPFTKVSLYLPFIGIVNLSTNDIIGGVISIKYRFDMFTGTCLAQILVTNKNLNDANMYQYTGNACMSLPITSANYARTFGAAIGAIGSVAAAIPTGGASLTAGAAVTAGLGVGASALSAGVDIQRSGSMTGNTGALGGMKPYVIIARPVPSIPNNYQSLYGNVSNVYQKIGNLYGYNMLDQFQLTNVNATSTEKNEIESILKSGFYIGG